MWSVALARGRWPRSGSPSPGRAASARIGGVGPGVASALVGRESEGARLAAFVDDLHRGAAAVLVRGEPGIGKTALWREALAGAEASGVGVLATRCVEAEMPVALCGLADVFEPVVV